MKNENRFPHEEFLNVFKTVHSNLRKFKYNLKNNQLSLSEKKLLKALYFYKKNKKEECLDLLRESPLPSEFLEGVRLYLLGLTLNQFGHYHYALEHLEKSVLKLESTPNEGFIVNPLSVLIIAYGNRREIQKMGLFLDKLMQIKCETDYHQIQRDYVELFYCVLSKRYEKGLKLISKYENSKIEAYKAFSAYFKVQEFFIYSHQKKYNECYRVLEEYKNNRGHVVRENYLYMKSLLDLLVHEKPLYIYKEDFGENPELYHQLEVLKNLLSGNLDGAKKFWLILSKHNPDLYKDDFTFTGDETLFSQALSRYKNLKIKTSFSKEELGKLKNKSEKLDYILTKSESPISAQELVKLLWDEEINDKNLSRLRNLLFHYSKNYQKHVDCYQSAYSLSKKAS